MTLTRLMKRFEGADLQGPPPILEGVYTDDNGSLGYKLCVASALRARPPLFVMLHGASQSASDFVAGTRMQEVVEECGGIALFPEQSRSAHPLGSWNWYDVRHQIAEGGEPSMIVGLTRRVAAQYRVDRRRVYVAGMSSGGAMAVILGRAFPGVYAAVGVHSGLPHGAARDLMSALRSMNGGPSEEADRVPPPPHVMPTIVFHGDSDRTVHPLNAVAVWMQAIPREGTCSTRAEVLSTAPTAVHGGRAVTLTTHHWQQQRGCAELWIVHGSGHAWTGGNAQASYTDGAGPDASREMLRFFLGHRLAANRRSTGD